MLHNVFDSKKRSSAWKHYTQTDNPSVVTCIRCCRKISISGGSTGNLLRHIKLKHPNILVNINATEAATAVEDISEDISETVNRSSELPVGAVLELHCENSTETQKYNADESQVQSMTYYVMEQMDVNKCKEINKQLLRIMVKDLYPSDFIEDREFISFVSMLNPNYTLPNYKSLSNELLSETHESISAELKSTLTDVSAVALTIDTWFSINNEFFFAVTAHYLNKDLELKASFLDCISFPKSCEINIVAFLQDLVADWGLSNKIVAVVSENTPALVEAVGECRWQFIPCFAHSLNTIVKAGLFHINHILAKVRNTVDYFKKDSTVMMKLLSLQKDMGLAYFKLKKDNSLRWNSTFDMITRFLKNKALLCANEVIEEYNTELSPDDWDVLEKVVSILVAFNTITVELCSEKTVPLSKLLHMVRFMIKHVNNSLKQLTLIPVKKVANTLKQGLAAQYKILEKNDIICQSVLLDPRFKKRGFPENYKEAYLSLRKEVVALNTKKINESQGSLSGIKINSKQSEYFIDMWSEFRISEKPSQNLKLDATVEIDAFVNEPYINMKDSPISYWASELNKNKFPSLFELVKSRFCVPATSVPCKNIFSKEGNNLLEKRSFITSGKIKEILFLQENL